MDEATNDIVNAQQKEPQASDLRRQEYLNKDMPLKEMISNIGKASLRVGEACARVG